MENQVRPWKVLADRNFGLFWSSLLVSAVGTQIANVTIAWQIYVMTNSPFQLGLAGLFRAVPLIFFSLTGGVVADRVDRRKLLIITQGSAALFALILGLLTTSGQVQVWHIYGFIFLTAAANSFDLPARTALIPNLVPKEHVSTAFALNVTLRQSATLTGPFLAGIIIAELGIAQAHYINALSFLGVIVALIWMRVREARAPSRGQSALQSLREGFSFVWRSPAIRAVLIMDTCVTFFGAYNSMMPVFARDLLGVGPKGLGALLGAPALGALLGSGIVILLGNPKRKGRLIVVVSLAYTISLILFALSRSFLLSLSIGFVLGALDAVGETLRVTVTQLMTPDHLRGRVQSLVYVFVVGGPLLGQTQIGVTASLLGASGATIVGGVVGSIAILSMAKRVSRLGESP